MYRFMPPAQQACGAHFGKKRSAVALFASSSVACFTTHQAPCNTSDVGCAADGESMQLSARLRQQQKRYVREHSRGAPLVHASSASLDLRLQPRVGAHRRQQPLAFERLARAVVVASKHAQVRVGRQRIHQRAQPGVG
jgi:hypothetical protein